MAPPFSSDSSVSKELASKTAPLEPGSIPDFARLLAAQISAADIHVRWPFTPAEWLVVHALIKRSGIPAMADLAVKAAGRARIESARYFLPGWKELAPLPEPGDERPALRSVPTTRSTTDDRVAAGLALAAKYRAEEERAALEAAHTTPKESA